MKPLIRESEVEERFVEVVEAHGGKAYKFISPGHVGVPDRLVFKGIDEAVKLYLKRVPRRRQQAEKEVRELIAAVLEFVELKAPDEEPDAKQLREHKRLRALGFKVSVIDTKEGAEEWADGG